MALNSLAILAAVASAGHDIAPAMAALADFASVAGRGAQAILRLGTRRITLIDEGYNANPGSMASALALLGGCQARGRKIVVLGEMRELGEAAVAYHTDLAPLIVDHGIDRVHAVGGLYDEFWRALPADRQGLRADTPDALKQLLLDELRDGDVLMLKGSHGSLIHELVDRLKRAARPSEAAVDTAEDGGALMVGRSAERQGAQGAGGTGKPPDASPMIGDTGAPASERYSQGAMRTVASMSQAAARKMDVAESELLEGARQLLQARVKMARLVPKGLLRDSAWDMMLELYISREEGGISYVKQLILTSGESPAAAMRRIDRLEEAGFIERFIDPLDRRRVIVQLSARGQAAMLAMLQHVFENEERERSAQKWRGPTPIE